MKVQDYRFRASQMGKIMTGTIGLTERQNDMLITYQERKKNATSGKAKPLTTIMEETLRSLIDLQKNPELPKTNQTEVRKIWRAKKYKRDFAFTNAYVQKGILQEEEGITLFQQYLSSIGINTLFEKNEKRFRDDFFEGTPDVFDKKNEKLGYDIKCSWSLDSFAFEQDALDKHYEYQNQTYMHLTGRKEWWTVYVLVNATEHQLNNEKLKWYYAYNAPSEDDIFFDDMENCQKACEKYMVYDYDRFVELFPFHNMIIPKDEWHGEGYDIPLADRVVIKKSTYNPEVIQAMKDRIKIARNYIADLENEHINN